MEGKIIFLTALALCSSTVLFEEKFDDGELWEKRWTQSTHKEADARGKFKLTAGKFYGDAEQDKGIQTSQDAKFYQLSAKIPVAFSSEGKQLVLQYTVKHEQNIDCGGGYIKLFPADIDPAKMHGDTPYNIMFGPDICGPGTKKVHVIFSYNGKNLLTKKDIRCKDDEYTHLYTLILNPDNTYEVRIDGEKVESGELEADWDFLAPKKIPDPDAKKPADWVDEKKIPEPGSVKPADWDDEPELISDPDAKKPDDWDNEEDGEWEAAQINNPKHKGEFTPAMIDNPLYKGEWEHPEIDNPEYKEDDKLHKQDNVGHIGFEIWQVKSGTIYDNILVTDDVKDAEEHAKNYFDKTKEAEKKMKEKQDEVEKAEEDAKAKKQEEEDKAKGKDAPKEEDGEEAEEDDEDEEEKDEEEPDDTKAEDKKPEEDATEEEKTEEEKPKDEL